MVKLTREIDESAHGVHPKASSRDFAGVGAKDTVSAMVQLARENELASEEGA